MVLDVFSTMEPHLSRVLRHLLYLFLPHTFLHTLVGRRFDFFSYNTQVFYHCLTVPGHAYITLVVLIYTLTLILFISFPSAMRLVACAFSMCAS